MNRIALLTSDTYATCQHKQQTSAQPDEAGHPFVRAEGSALSAGFSVCVSGLPGGTEPTGRAEMQMTAAALWDLAHMIMETEGPYELPSASGSPSSPGRPPKARALMPAGVGGQEDVDVRLKRRAGPPSAPPEPCWGPRETGGRPPPPPGPSPLLLGLAHGLFRTCLPSCSHWASPSPVTSHVGLASAGSGRHTPTSLLRAPDH